MFSCERNNLAIQILVLVMSLYFYMTLVNSFYNHKSKFVFILYTTIASFKTLFSMFYTFIQQNICFVYICPVDNVNNLVNNYSFKELKLWTTYLTVQIGVKIKKEG